MDKLLDRAILIAAKSHLGQVGRDGEPYVLHPIRMMIQAKTGEEKTVAVLHDVIEKTSVDITYLREAGFSDKIIQAIDSLTRRDSESYDEYIDRVEKNDLAIKIKIIDLDDNMSSLEHCRSNREASKKLIKYQKARERLI